MSGTAVPGNVNLAKQKPYAVSAYSRRVKSLANNAQSFGPDAYVNITLDTSTPGSFLDPLQSYLKWDLSIINSNPFADFVSFGQAGAASLIEEFRIYVQGTPIEEILQYNVFYELAMNQNSQCQQPYELFIPHETADISGIFHLNAIKPPMMDRLGRPMYGRILKSASTSRSSSWISPGGGFLQAKMIASQATMTSKMCFSGARPYFTTPLGGYVPNLVADAQSLLLGTGTNNPSATAGNGGQAVATLSVNQATAAPYAQTFPGYFWNTNFDGSSAATGSFPNIVTLAGGNAGAISNLNSGLELLSTQVKDNGGLPLGQSYSYLQTASGGVLPFGGSSVEIPSLVGVTSELSADLVDPDFDPTNPLNWCSILPATIIRPDLKTLGPQNLQDYFMFLSNCKYLPIGMPGLDKYNASSYATTPSIPSGFVTSSNFRNLQQYSNENDVQTFTYTCCIPLISGVLGSFADKCWPTMLVAPGSMYIQIRTASPQKAFQLSMDPCRRVLGTIRDYLPFGGSLGGIYGQVGKNNRDATGSANPGPLDGNLSINKISYNAPLGSVSAFPGFDTGLTGFLPLVSYADYRAVSTFAVGASGEYNNTLDGRPIGSKINAYAALGSTLTSATFNLNSQMFGTSSTNIRGFGLHFKPYSVAALEGRWTIGRSYVNQAHMSTITDTGVTYMHTKIASEEGSMITPATNGFGTNMAPNSSLAVPRNVAIEPPTSAVLPPNALYPNTADSINVVNVASGNLIPVSVCARSGFTDMSGNNDQAIDSIFGTNAGFSPDADVTVEFGPSGIPLPQYWLHATPWLQKTFASRITTAPNPVPGAPPVNVGTELIGMAQINVASEATACYGTYLSASVPQCRRVLTHLSSTTGAGTVTYQLSNIEFVSQQIILPDSVSASILEDAAQGDISINSNSLHNYQTPIATSTSQNLIIPAKIASANTMYCLFQPQVTVTGPEAFMYNSLRGICPFGSVGSTLGSGLATNGLTGPYNATGLGVGFNELAINNIPCASGQLQVQLKIGNELLPQQPLTTMAEILTENVKAQHKLFDTTANINATFSLTNRGSYTLGTEPQQQVLAYDVIAPETFCTTFVSAELCDDQTAINNPAMTYVYACEANYIQASGATVGAKSLSSYVINRKPCQFELFQPPASTFVLGFDLDTWSRFSDVSRSGKFLGNNTITLTMQSANALGLSPQQARSGGYVLQTFVVHDIRFSFQAGGSVVSYY